MERQIVGAPEQVVQRDQFNPQVGGHLLGDERVVGDDAHAKRRGAAGHFLADAPESGKAESFLPDFLAKKLLFLPFALLHRRVGSRHVTSKRQDQAEGQFRHADAVGTRGVHDDDAACAGSGDVNVVDTGAGAGNHTQTWGGCDEWRGDPGGAANDECVGVRKVTCQLLRRATGAGIDIPALRSE